jgi:L-rhamnose-H+ transport protein
VPGRKNSLNSKVVEAIVLIMLAAVMNGAYTLPMKLNREWAWEHSWFAFTLIGVPVVPTLIALATVPGLFAIYPRIPGSTLAAMALFGAGWGVSLVLFGLSISIVGVAITFAVCLGTSAASGALIPLLVQHPDQVFTRQGALILAGMCVILVGVGLCGVAGHRRDRMLKAEQKSGSRSFLRGFSFALISGITGSMLNLGLAFGGAIQERARQQGASEAMMSNASWLPCLYAGFIPGIIYCLSIMKKKGNMAQLISRSRWYYWLMATLMGVFWFGSIICYSFATIRLGNLGPIIGWPLFMSAVVIASSIAGVLAGEWSKAGRAPFRIMTAGVGCLVAAMAILALAGI